MAEERADVERLLTFVDAIVAIAITLLVLPLAELAGDIGHESVWRVVREHAGEFGAFLLSFVVIARLWIAQHRVVRGATSATQALTVILIGWTLTIVFLPFPTALLADTGGQAATKVFYIGTLALSEAALGALAWTVRRQLPSGASSLRVRPQLLNAVFTSLALVVTLTIPVTGYYPLLLLLLADPTDALYRRLRARPSR